MAGDRDRAAAVQSVWTDGGVPTEIDRRFLIRLDFREVRTLADVGNEGVREQRRERLDKFGWEWLGIDGWRRATGGEERVTNGHGPPSE